MRPARLKQASPQWEFDSTKQPGHKTVVALSRSDGSGSLEAQLSLAKHDMLCNDIKRLANLIMDRSLDREASPAEAAFAV